MTRKNQNSWTFEHYLEVREIVKAELDRVQETEESLANHCIQQIESLSDGDNDQQLERFVYCIALLVFYIRTNDTRRPHAKKIMEIAELTLKAQDFSDSSPLMALYGDIHLAKSQLAFQDKEFRKSTWEQILTNRKLKLASDRGQWFQEFALIIRYFRLGFGRVAQMKCQDVLANSTDEKILNRTEILLQKILRSQGHPELAEKRGQDCQEDRFDTIEQQELRWESICRAVQNSGDLTQMLKVTRKGGEHYHPSYLIESFFWVHSVPSKAYLPRVSKIKSLTRNKTIALRQSDPMVKLAMRIEDFYNTSVPLEFRIQAVADTIEVVDQVPTIDKELLVWAALARCFLRHQAVDLSLFAIEQYRQICLRVSDGQSADVLGYMHDFYEKNWFQLDDQDQGLEDAV